MWDVYALRWRLNGVRHMMEDVNLRKAHYKCSLFWDCKATLQVVYNVRDPSNTNTTLVGKHNH